MWSKKSRTRKEEKHTTPINLSESRIKTAKISIRMRRRVKPTNFSLIHDEQQTHNKVRQEEGEEVFRTII